MSRTTNYVIAGDSRDNWWVVDIRGGYECRMMCQTDSKGKAKLIATLLNNYATDSDAPRYTEKFVSRETSEAEGTTSAKTPENEQI